MKRTFKATILMVLVLGMFSTSFAAEAQKIIKKKTYKGKPKLTYELYVTPIRSLKNPNKLVLKYEIDPGGTHTKNKYWKKSKINTDLYWYWYNSKGKIVKDKKAFPIKSADGKSYKNLKGNITINNFPRTNNKIRFALKCTGSGNWKEFDHMETYYAPCTHMKNKVETKSVYVPSDKWYIAIAGTGKREGPYKFATASNIIVKRQALQTPTYYYLVKAPGKYVKKKVITPVPIHPNGDPKQRAVYKYFTTTCGTTAKTDYHIANLIPIFKVTYNANKGAWITGTKPDPKYVYKGDSITIINRKPIRKGYDFNCWNGKPSGTGRNYYPGEQGVIINSDKVFYASWNENNTDCKVIYDPNGGSWSDGISPNKTGIPKGSTISITSKVPNNGKMVFKGWSTSRNGKVAYASGQENVTINNDLFLYAVWGKPKYNVIYDPNGGKWKTGSAPNKTGIKDGTKITITAKKPIRTKYTFLGWSANKNATTPQYKSGQGNVVIKKDLYLYAVWKAKNPKPVTYKITYNTNGGKWTTGISPDKSNIKPGSSIFITAKRPIRKDYIFIGWSANKNATKSQYKSSAKVKMNSNLYLYAVWKGKADDISDRDIDIPIITPIKERFGDMIRFIDLKYINTLGKDSEWRTDSKKNKILTDSLKRKRPKHVYNSSGEKIY